MGLAKTPEDEQKKRDDNAHMAGEHTSMPSDPKADVIYKQNNEIEELEKKNAELLKKVKAYEIKIQRLELENYALAKKPKDRKKSEKNSRAPLKPSTALGPMDLAAMNFQKNGKRKKRKNLAPNEAGKKISKPSIKTK